MNKNDDVKKALGRRAARPRARLPRIESLEPRTLLSNFYISPTGSDSGAGTITSPGETVQRGVKAVAPGDTLVLRGGTYAGGVTVRTDDVTIRSYPGEHAVVSAPINDSAIGMSIWFNARGGRVLDLEVRGGWYYAL